MQSNVPSVAAAMTSSDPAEPPAESPAASPAQFPAQFPAQQLAQPAQEPQLQQLQFQQMQQQLLRQVLQLQQQQQQEQQQLLQQLQQQAQQLQQLGQQLQLLQQNQQQNQRQHGQSRIVKVWVSTQTREGELTSSARARISRNTPFRRVWEDVETPRRLVHIGMREGNEEDPRPARINRSRIDEPVWDYVADSPSPQIFFFAQRVYGR
jgi:hypothetical protein